MIVAPSAGNEKQLHKTFGGLLRAALTDGRRLAPEEVPFEAGDPEWFRGPGVERGPTAAEVAWQAESLAPLEVQLAAPAARRWRGLHRVSPSRLEGGTRVRLAAPRGDRDADRSLARNRGKVIHAWFQQIEWLDDGSPSDDRLREVAARSGLSLRPDDVDRWLADFHAMLARPHIAACLRRSAYEGCPGARLKVETERPFAVRDGDRLLVGSIDRLVTICDKERLIAADVLDFKTDAISAHDQHALSEKVRFYRPQLQAYCQAVTKMAGGELKQISANLVLLEAGVVIPIPCGVAE
jgi:ATP-dependent exoDNAse (exonuclease V) beta subunit